MICLMHLLHSSEEISEEAVLAAFRHFWESVLDGVESTEEEDEENEEAVLVSFKLFWESVSDEVERTEEVDGISEEEEFKFDQVESAEEPEEAASILEERLHCVHGLSRITEIIRREFYSLETFLKDLDASEYGEGVLINADILVGKIEKLSIYVAVNAKRDSHDFEILVKKNLPGAENRHFWTVVGGLKERVRENYEKLNELRQQSILKFQYLDQEAIRFMVSTMDIMGREILKMLGSSFLMESHAHLYSNNILENMKLGEEVNQQGATDEEV